jgi:uncharacterized Zn-binding protein involved in type VI secretion
MRLGDKNSAGGVILTGNPTVLVNFRPVATIGEKVSPHPCCGLPGCAKHCAATTTSISPTVLVGFRPICTSLAIDTCGHVRAIGSFTVFVGL